MTVIKELSTSVTLAISTGCLVGNSHEITLIYFRMNFNLNEDVCVSVLVDLGLPCDLFKYE